MRLFIFIPVLLIALLAVDTGHAANVAGQQTLLAQAKAAPAKYPPVTIYTLATCPHCKEAKEYFTHNNIPYTNHDVGMDDAAMDEAMQIYEKLGVPEAQRGVPLIVIGDTVIQGFNKEKVEKALGMKP